MIRLAAFDLDGTVMGADRSIAPRVRAALAAAQARGVLVTLATGRMFPSVLPYALDLNLDAPLLACQGGWIQWTHAPTPLLRIPLPVDIAREAIALAEQHDWHTVLYADGEIFLRELRELPSFYEALLGLEKALIPDWEAVLTQHTPDKVLFVAQADSGNIPETVITAADFTDGRIQIADVMVKCKLAPSKGEAKRLISQGGVEAADNKISYFGAVLTPEDFKDGGVVIKKGKKTFHRVILK